jgi:hypothetical protein
MSTISTSRRYPDRVRSLLIAGIAGALFGSAGVTLVYAFHPTLTLDMDRALPRRFASGLYDSERSGDISFAWTSQRSDIKLAGLARRTAWRCSLSFRGARSDPATQPSIVVAVDGMVATAVTATNDFQEATIVLPPRRSSGAIVTVTSSSTLVPGSSDPRQLGVQLRRVACSPQDGVALPPSSTVRGAAVTGAIFGVALVLSGVPLGLILGGLLMLAALQALPLSAGPAPYMGLADTMTVYAAWIGVVAAAIVAAVERFRPGALDIPARVAIALTAAVLYLKLLGLLHPSKLLIDAVFHAHRFEWVIAGKYYFTQPMPGGVTFPYAIGLYVFALPWSVFTQDHVTLLRVVVCSVQAAAGALLYPVIVKAWNDRTAAVSAVVLFNVVPLPYGLLGNANLTNSFAEAVALMAVLTASWVSGARALALLAVFLLSTLAFLSHVSTLALLSTTLMALAVGYRFIGTPELRQPALSIGLVTIGSVILALVLYYGHFGDVYKNALRVRADTTATQPQSETASPPAPAAGQEATLAARIANAIGFGVGMIGWPILLLAVVGAWRSLVERSRDRATLDVLAWAVACALFLGVAVMRVDAPFQRYAAEFFGRVLLATFPAAVVLAARGTGWLWKHGLPCRLASGLVIVCAVVLGMQNWMAWFWS